MRLQLFKGTYAVLLLLAVAGLHIMLRRQAGDGYSLTLWLVLVVLGAGGLVATAADVWAFSGTVAGLLTTVFLRLSDIRSAGLAPTPGGQMRIDLALGAYVLFTITLAVILAARNRNLRH